METRRYKIVGTAPLLMHNSQMTDPLNDYTRKIRAITSKPAKKKTDEDHAAVAWLEYQGGIYFRDGLGVYIPGQNIEAAIREAARLKRAGKDVERGAQVLEDTPLIYDGPKTVEKLDQAGFFLKASVGIGKSRTMRCRPCFMQWGAEFTVIFNPEVIRSAEELDDYIQTAGELTGIGDWRPRYGRFSKEVL